jgi:glutathione S-transferase
MLKLLNSFVSPYAARVRIAIYAYDLPVEIAPSGQWLPDYRKSPDFVALHPIGRIPVLLLDDGSALPESGVIVEYLADAFPACGLRPADARVAAQARLLAQLIDTYVQARGAPLVGQLFTGQRDQRAIASCVGAMDEGLSHIEHYMRDEGFEAGRAITLADCALAPMLFFFAERMVAAFGLPSIIEPRPKLAAYWHAVQAVPAVQKVLAEMREAIAHSPLSMLVAATD